MDTIVIQKAERVGKQENRSDRLAIENFCLHSAIFRPIFVPVGLAHNSLRNARNGVLAADFNQKIQPLWKFILNGYCGKKVFFSMDLRPFKVVEVAQSTRIKELPLICLLWLADISRVSVCALTHSPLYCFLFHSSLSPNPFPPCKSSNIWTTFHLLRPIQKFIFNWRL